MTSQPPSQSTHDVLILGAGVIGLSCALQLLKAGRQVTLIDRGATAGATSQGNCGTITPSHSPPLTMPGMVAKALRWTLRGDAPLWVKPTLNPQRLNWFWRFARQCRSEQWQPVAQARAQLLKTSRSLLEQLVAEEQLQCDFSTSGTLYVWRDEAHFEQAAWMPAILEQLGLNMQRLDGAQARAMEPTLNDSIIGAFHNPGDARLRPERYSAELARRVTELGGTIIEHCAVTGLESNGDALIAARTADGRLQAREFVLALGAWSPELGRQLQLTIPIQPGKGYSITYPRPQHCPSIPLVLEERSVCVTAWEDGFRLGSTMEFSGYDSHLNRKRLAALEHAANEYLQGVDHTTRLKEWYGWRPMTWDELPLIGRSPVHHNLTLATGHGMLGVSMSAVTGLLVRELICEQPPSLDLRPYDPARFRHGNGLRRSA